MNLIPTLKTGSARWYGTKHEWTDEQGRYNFNRLEPGAYLLAVNSFEASAGPDEELPFATLYYHGAEDESGADAVSVKAAAGTDLAPLRLRRLDVVTIPVKVVWENEAAAERSDIVVRNIRYFGLLHGTQIDQWGWNDYPAKGVFIRGKRHQFNATLAPSSISASRSRTNNSLWLTVPHLLN